MNSRTLSNLSPVSPYLRNRILKTIPRQTTFKLEDRRKSTLNISKNGTVMISTQCTTNQYNLHTNEEIAELFVSCGQTFDI